MKRNVEETIESEIMTDKDGNLAEITKIETTETVSIAIGDKFEEAEFLGSFTDKEGIMHKKYSFKSKDFDENPVIYDVEHHTNPSKKEAPLKRLDEIGPRFTINQNLRRMLHDTPIGDVSLKTKDIIFCVTTDTLLSAYQKLSENSILCLPVSNKEKDQFYGFLDILDIITYINDHIHKPKSAHGHVEEPKKQEAFKIGDRVKKLDPEKNEFTYGIVSNITPKRIIVTWDDTSHANFGHENKILMHDVVSEEKRKAFKKWYDIKEITQIKCQEVINYSGRNPPTHKDFHESIQHIIDSGVFDNHHRIALLDKGKVASILTQTNLLEFIFENRFWDELGSLALLTVGHLHLGLRVVNTITTGKLVFEAFQKIIDDKVSALAIVGSKDKLIGTLSASDLKGVGYNMELFSKLFETVGEFMSEKLKVAPVTVGLDTKFREVLALFHDNQIHRVFVTDEKQKLLGVITPSDIFKCLRSPKHTPIDSTGPAQTTSQV